MSNTTLTVDMITRRALMVAIEKAKFIGTIDRQYDDQFANSPKIGNTLRVRKPMRFTRRQGSRVMDVQDATELSQTLTVATQDGVDMRFFSDELSQNIDDFSQRYIEPAMGGLMSAIDGDILAGCTKQVYNLTGTAGTVVGTVAASQFNGDTSAVSLAQAKLNQGIAPEDGRSVQMDSVTMATVVQGNRALFNPTGTISEGFKEGYVGRAFGADFITNEKTLVMNNGSDITVDTDSTGLVAASVDAAGGYTQIDMHTAMAVTNQKVGMVFTLPDVYACHPDTKAKLGHLQQFTISAVGATYTTVQPTIYLTGPYQNVCKVTGAVNVTTDFDAKTLTFFGSASTGYRQNLMYHKQFATFVTADLPLMSDSVECVRRTQDGISLRVWKGSDIINDRLLMRIDILYGYAVLRPEWACRISN